MCYAVEFQISMSECWYRDWGWATKMSKWQYEVLRNIFLTCTNWVEFGAVKGSSMSSTECNPVY